MALISTSTLIGCLYVFSKYVIPAAKETIEGWFEPKSNPVLPSAKSLVIEGLPGSGKTSLYMKLGATGLNVDEATEEQTFPSFKLGDITIKEGRDFGGGKEYVDDGQLQSHVKNHDLVIFLFDVSKFIDPNHFEYRDLCCGRLQVIYNACGHDVSKVIVFGTHMGRYPNNVDTALSEIRRLIYLKDYSDFFADENFRVVELQRSSDVNIVKDMVVRRLDAHPKDSSTSSDYYSSDDDYTSQGYFPLSGFGSEATYNP